MQVSRAIYFLLGSLLFSSNVYGANKCELMWVPSQFSSVFSQYRDNRYLLPVSKVTLEQLKNTEQGQLHHRIEINVFEDASLQSHETRIKAELYYDSETRFLLV